MKHELKVHPHHFQRIKDGSKTFEIRSSEPGYQMGDELVIREFDPTPSNALMDAESGFTSEPPLNFKIGFVQVISNKEVIFSLLPSKKSKS